MATHRHYRGSALNPSVKYLRCRFEVESIGEAVDPATDYTYELALLDKKATYDPDALVWQNAVYATAGGVHYILSALGTGKTIDPLANSYVYIRATSLTLEESPVIFPSAGDVEVV